MYVRGRSGMSLAVGEGFVAIVKSRLDKSAVVKVCVGAVLFAMSRGPGHDSATRQA